MASAENPPFDLSAAAKWRPRLEWLALFIAVSSACLIAGWVVEELGISSADESGWAKIAGFSTAIAGFWMIAAIVTALLLVLILRVVFTWPEQTPSGVARTTLALIVINGGAIAVAAVLGIVAVFADSTGDSTLTGASKAGYTIVFAGQCLLAVAIAVFGARGFSTLKTSAAPEPVVPSVAAVA
jgi:hypothetical protein